MATAMAPLFGQRLWPREGRRTPRRAFRDAFCLQLHARVPGGGCFQRKLASFAFRLSSATAGTACFLNRNVLLAESVVLHLRRSPIGFCLCLKTNGNEAPGSCHVSVMHFRLRHNLYLGILCIAADGAFRREVFLLTRDSQYFTS